MVVDLIHFLMRVSAVRNTLKKMFDLFKVNAKNMECVQIKTERSQALFTPGIEMHFCLSVYKWMTLMQGRKCFELVHFWPLPEVVENTLDQTDFLE